MTLIRRTLTVAAAGFGAGLATVLYWPPCRSCGCIADAHWHDRPGTDCSACRCPRYRRWVALT